MITYPVPDITDFFCIKFSRNTSRISQIIPYKKKISLLVKTKYSSITCIGPMLRICISITLPYSVSISTIFIFAIGVIRRTKIRSVYAAHTTSFFHERCQALSLLRNRCDNLMMTIEYDTYESDFFSRDRFLDKTLLCKYCWNQENNNANKIFHKK